MQTLQSLRSFRDLRAVSPGQNPRRRRPHPMRRCALEWKGVSPLPNLPRPTSEVGLRPGLMRRQDDRDTSAVPGLLAAVSARALRNRGSCDPVPERVCRAAPVRQTALSCSLPAAAGVAGQRESLDRASIGLASVWTPAPLLPFAPPAQRCGARQAEQKVRACGRTASADYRGSHSGWPTIGEDRAASALLSGLCGG